MSDSKAWVQSNLQVEKMGESGEGREEGKRGESH